MISTPWTITTLGKNTWNKDGEWNDLTSTFRLIIFYKDQIIIISNLILHILWLGKLRT
ncbi:MAG: hypothetical protein ACTSSC_12310 [Promethearchaeota archaeon]